MRHLLPLASENKWTDLLATLIELDPQPLARLLGVAADLQVKREVVVPTAPSKSDRLDLLLCSSAGTPIAAIEAKLLSDVGKRQLHRYSESFPGAQVYRVLQLANLPIASGAPAPWQPLTWEDVLDAFAESPHTWVAATARAWRSWIREALPQVDEDTVWNDVPSRPAEFELALRARMAWLHAHLDGLTLEHDLRGSAAGGSWVVRMWSPLEESGYRVQCEVEEGLTAQQWRPDAARSYHERLKGPSIWIGLLQTGVADSASFDWARLAHIFRQTVVDAAGKPTDDRAWIQTTPGLRDPSDREQWSRVVAAGAPRWLGKGFGMGQARRAGECMFGARFSMPPTATLGEMLAELRRSEGLVRQMAAVPVER